MLTPPSRVLTDRRAASEERILIQALRLAQATAPERAQPLARLGIAHDATLDRLLVARVVRATTAGDVYLDEMAAHARGEVGPGPARVSAALISGILALGALGAGLFLMRM
jgi:hypothetical protein